MRVFSVYPRAGHKLEAALEHFQVNVEGKRVVDSGLSTGGFTDCLLQRGASHVVGVDVGYGQVRFLAKRSLLRCTVRFCNSLADSFGDPKSPPPDKPFTSHCRVKQYLRKTLFP